MAFATSRGIGPLAAVLVSAAAAQSAVADPLTYIIDFSGGVGLLAPAGLFTYDAASSTFTNFLVSWNRTVYDLTASANAPTVGNACGGLASSGVTGFALMNKGLCGGLYDRWFASSTFGSSTFAFSSQTLALPERNAARITATGPGEPSGVSSAVGDWTLAAPFRAPGTPTFLSNGSIYFSGGGLYVPGQGFLPINYQINFNGGAGMQPDFGIFNYDASTTTFSTFLVKWHGVLYDLTSAANAPQVGTACPGTGSSGATGFALMSKSLCGGLYDRWFASSDFGSSRFSFSSQTLALPERNAASIAATGAGSGTFPSDFAAGDWTLTYVGAVPEPSTLSTLALGLAMLGGLTVSSRRRSR